LRYPAAETAAKHRRILKQATRLFRENGFDRVSIPQIMKSAGLTHGSFYNHFASKTDLVGDCISHGAAKSLSGIARAEPSVAGKTAYIEDYLSVAHRDNPGNGCLMSALGSEVHRDPEAQSAMTRFIGGFIDRLSAQFPWSSKHRARRDAIRATASLVGGLILARAVNDEALSREILREVAAGVRGRASSDQKV
jgi:TetR/AcrR family transcriptional regulator, transcriptional repressor for nem operon